MSGEPGAAVQAIFRTLIETIKAQGSAANPGTMETGLFSQLVLGMPVLFEDYGNPFIPQLDTTVKETLEGVTPQQLSAEVRRSIAAAFKTSLLCRTMLQVTKDGLYRQFPTGRSLEVAYKGLTVSMTPTEIPPLSEDLQQRIDEAKKVLYVFVDGKPVMTQKTEQFKAYRTNQLKIATAKAAFASAFAAAQIDPVLQGTFPITGAPLRIALEQAREDFVAEGGEDVARALATLNAIGGPFEATMISEAKTNFDDWQLLLAGIVPSEMAYSFVLPSNWCDPNDDTGFTKLEVNQSTINSSQSSNLTTSSSASWATHASSASGGGAISLGFLAFGGEHSETNTSNSFQDTSETNFHSVFSDSATGLNISLQYALCSIFRPWLISDIFYMKNWFLSQNKKHAISDGTIDGGVGTDKLLPMIPQQFLVIKNVSISAQSWGSDGEVLSRFYGESASSAQTDTSSTAGMGGVCLGFINFGGRGRASSFDASGQANSFTSQSSSSQFGANFDGQTLSIRGAQIVGFLSDIVNASPPEDDPSMVNN
jgi:hypothetical protein